jgi:hypothetical protein
MRTHTFTMPHGIRVTQPIFSKVRLLTRAVP